MRVIVGSPLVRGGGVSEAAGGLVAEALGQAAHERSGVSDVAPGRFGRVFHLVQPRVQKTLEAAEKGATAFSHLLLGG